MTRFLKLTNIIINTAKIVTIDVLPTKYTIRMSDQKIDGWLLFTSGSVESINTKIEVCGCGIRNRVEDNHAYSEGLLRRPSEYENKDPIDYQLVKKWIHQTI